MANTLQNLAKLMQSTSGSFGGATKQTGQLLSQDTSNPISLLMNLVGQVGGAAQGETTIPGKGQTQEGAISEGGITLPAQGLPQATVQLLANVAEKAQVQKQEFEKMEAIEHQKAAETAIKKQAKENVEALGPEKVLQELGQSALTPQSASKTGEGEQTPTTEDKPEQVQGDRLSKAGQVTQDIVGPVGDILTQLLTLGGRLESPQAAGRELQREQAATLKQERETGQTAAAREKQFIDLQKELAKKGSPDALTPENAGKFNLLLEGAGAVEEAANIFLGDPTQLQGLIIENKVTPGLMKSQTGRKLEAAVERMIQARTRIETGAALQPSELKSTAKRFLPRVGDSSNTAQGRMKPLFDFFQGSLNVADPTGVHRQRATGGQSQGVVMVDANGNRALVDPNTNQVIREL